MDAKIMRCYLQVIIVTAAFFLAIFGIIQPVYAYNEQFKQMASNVNLILATNTFVFYPKQLKWAAINSNGTVVKTGKASGGSNYCRDIRRSCRTPIGTYSVIGEGGANCRSSRYPLGRGGAKMPYCMYFSKYYAIHGSYELPNYNASHGCIRIRPSDAKWLQQNFIRIGSKVVVKPY